MAQLTKAERKIINMGKELVFRGKSFSQKKFTLKGVYRNPKSGDWAQYESKDFNIGVSARYFKVEKVFPQTVTASSDGKKMTFK